ncbi:hypothetical protein DICPUDRAFT_76319 [Dictyostelium purpureum]|uniref:Uncharacterized protein n=1 Tax=Dictyostelium purpureum TaxID=5786 RepID=F0ZD90_DICPU|nr:uncharacterized protein DICPUDRAFT_76319 [Dictyostelium purpureum]EGC38096.1 hypothetical protein DICPUDRAFT_76319 [Dictyostelium purpureum]|eukprot:XP_003285403.1 hypothetical protein DICPUDRAFT_76319 [Dictyostelium purpureum]
MEEKREIEPYEKFLYLKNLLPVNFNLTGTRNQQLILQIKIHYETLMVLIEGAANDFINKNYISFDPLVGENSCHFRAIITWFIFEKQYNLLKERFLKLLIKLKEVRDRNDLNCFKECKNENLTFVQILNRYNLNIKISMQEYYLISNWILTFTKLHFHSPDPFSKDISDHSKLSPLKNSIHFNKNIIKHLKKNLSEITASIFIEYSSNDTDTFNKLNSLLYINNAGLNCLPIYWGTKVLVNKLIEFKTPIVMVYRLVAKDLNLRVIDSILFKYKYINGGYKVIEISNLKLDLNPSLKKIKIHDCGTPHDDDAAVFIYSNCLRNTDEFTYPIVEYLVSKIVEIGITELLNLSMAIHKQYQEPNCNDQKIINLKDNEYLTKCEIADSLGFNILNPHLFYMEHIFTESIKNTDKYFK